MGRRLNGSGAISGHAECGEVRVKETKHDFSAVESIVGTASRNAKDDEIFLVLIKKNLYETVDASMQVGISNQQCGVAVWAISDNPPFSVQCGFR